MLTYSSLYEASLKDKRSQRQWDTGQGNVDSKDDEEGEETCRAGGHPLNCKPGLGNMMVHGVWKRGDTGGNICFPNCQYLKSYFFFSF